MPPIRCREHVTNRKGLSPKSVGASRFLFHANYLRAQLGTGESAREFEMQSYVDRIWEPSLGRWNGPLHKSQKSVVTQNGLKGKPKPRLGLVAGSLREQSAYELRERDRIRAPESELQLSIL